MRRLAVSLLAVIVCGLLMTSCARSGEPSGSSSGSQTEQIELSSGGLDRTAVVHLPPNGGEGSPMPVVLVFHGRGGTAEGIERISHFDSVADDEGFIAVYPQGHRRSWAGGNGNSPTERAGVDDVGFVGALLNELDQRYEVDEDRVFATGLSNGAFFSQRLGCELSDRVAAIVPVAGTQSTGFAPSCRPARPVSVLEIHGTDDPIVPYEGGPMRGGKLNILSAEEAVGNRASTDGCSASPNIDDAPDAAEDGTSLTIRTYPGCAADTAVELYTVNAGGHTWPGGEQYLPAALIGETSHQLDASHTIWEFFAAHPKKALG